MGSFRLRQWVGYPGARIGATGYTVALRRANHSLEPQPAIVEMPDPS